MIASSMKLHVIEHGKAKLIIMDSPNDTNASMYVTELKALGVTDVVRTCERTYSPEPFEKEGIQVHDMMFPDGAAPPQEIIQRWLDLISERYRGKTHPGIVAVHCVAGLGRAPVMAAVALIEVTGIDADDAIIKIRAKNKGALNVMQLNYLQSYKRGACKGSEKACCAMM